MSPKPSVRSERIPQIIKAAIKTFARKGLYATRMEDIAHEAKLSIGGVYWYYKSREDIVLAIADSAFGPDLEHLQSLLDQTGTIRSRLLGYMQVNIQATSPDLSLMYEFYSLGGRDKRVRAKFLSYFTSYQEQLAKVIQQGIANNEFRSVNPKTVALTLISIYEGILEMYMINPSMDVEKALVESMNLLFDGITK